MLNKTGSLQLHQIFSDNRTFRIHIRLACNHMTQMIANRLQIPYNKLSLSHVQAILNVIIPQD